MQPTSAYLATPVYQGVPSQERTAGVCRVLSAGSAAALSAVAGQTTSSARLSRSVPVRHRNRPHSSIACHGTSVGLGSADMATEILQGSAFIWQTPLTLPPPFPAEIAQLLPKHAVVLVECSDGGFVAFDFEPQDKNALGTALELLAGGSVPGQFGVKRLRRLPSGARRVGLVRPGATVQEVLVDLNNTFDSRLSLSSNDCNSYARTVLSHLLAESDYMTGGRLYSTIDLDALEKQGKAVYKEPSLVGAVILVAGTTVGAGILALPAVTQPVGFVPSTAALLVAWVYMATTGLLIAEVALAEMASSGKVSTSLQSMAAQTIGPVGAAVSSVSFIVVHFGLLVAYLSRGGELLAVAFPEVLATGLPAPAIFAAVFGGLVFLTKGSDALEVANNAFASVLLVSFVALVLLAAPSFEPGRLFEVANWGHTTDIAPTLLLSLVFHNVVPTVCAQLEGDRHKITIAITLGSFLPLLMFLVWNGVVLAAVEPGASPGSDPLDLLRASGGAALGTGVLVFSLTAIITSFIGFVLALTDFFADALRPSEGGASDSADKQEDSELIKVRDFALTLILPLAVACYDPTLFFQAIDKAGAFGVSMLFGFLPAWLALSRRAMESPVLAQQPGMLGGYVRGPLVPGGILILVLVAGGALAVVAQNALELLAGAS